MLITNIVLVNIFDQQLESQLKLHGYNPIFVSDLSSILDIDVPFGMVIIHENSIGEADSKDLERLYFVSNGVPICVYIEDPYKISQGLKFTLIESTLERIYKHEVDNGMAISRVDRIYLTSGLDSLLRLYQQSEDDKILLQKEINLRNRILEHERELNANITGSITSGLVVIDITDNIFLINEYAKRLLKISKNDILGTKFSLVLPDKINRFVESVIKKIKGQWKQQEIQKIDFNDTILEISTYRMNDYQHNPIGILLLINDVTEQENTTIQLYRTEKLATMGTMLSGIAHELRNPLSIISARAQMALRKKDFDKEWAIKSFESIETQIQRCSTIINSLLNYTRNKAVNNSIHKISEILDETLTYVEYQNIFDSVKVEKQYQKGLIVYGDRSRFVQVFLNVIINAADAMEGKGILTIKTMADTQDYVIVEINDTGCGIDPAIKEKIFDPFFTTKDPGRGTGLGLSIVYKIVQDSGGEIWFKSEPKNTSFFIKLPSGRRKIYERKDFVSR